ncbi:MAG: hypothetical protein IJ747_05035 [Lachnospiraceae bacterium]|nr:hypothetical protein [Lachnospiraceae bacterium]
MDWRQNTPFASVEGVIVEIVPGRAADGNIDGCSLFFTVEDDEGNTANFLVHARTYVVDAVMLREGMRAGFWYRTDEPIPLIYPPQYRAVAAAQLGNERTVVVDHFDEALVNTAGTLQLLPNRFTAVRTTNGQIYAGSLADRDLAVVYITSTKSIPAQTTPTQVIVLCDSGEQGCL